jgi:hypothetical protein
VPSTEFEVRESEHGTGPVLILRGPWSIRCKREMATQSIRGIRLSEAMGFLNADISFLKDLEGLVSVEVYSTQVRALDAIQFVSGLEVLGLQCPASFRIPVHNLSRLRVAMVAWRKGMESLLASKALEYLNITSYPYESLSPLAELRNLRCLLLTSRKLQSLAGVESLESLEQLDLYSCPELRKIDRFTVGESQRTVEIALEACRHISKRPIRLSSKSLEPLVRMSPRPS